MGVLAGTLGGSAAAFASTHWSVVLQCAQEDSSPDDADRCRAALETLCRDYWPPLYSCVRRRGYPPAEAQDLVQDFFVHLLGTRAYARADPARGRFRTFLLASLKNFLANAYDHAGRQKRGGDQTFVLLDEHLAEAEAAALAADKDEVTADRLFEQRWAASILHHAWETLRRETEAAGRGELLHALRPSAGSVTAAGDHRTVREFAPPASRLALCRTRRSPWFWGIALSVKLPASGCVQVGNVVEQDHRELKGELGPDHFEVRSWQGWCHHVALVTAAFASLRQEQRRRVRDTKKSLPPPTLP